MGLGNELLWLFKIPYANGVRILLFQPVFRRWLKVGTKHAETDEALSIARGRQLAQWRCQSGFKLIQAPIATECGFGTRDPT
ncbi:hypothetical protein A9Z42_0078050 [Trichoderma parareesei]|uniref:Uncharacterized protein n=1 Tax=Trichoderma parareesei TaxID=858221 RepID=A0A2H3A2S3_TRIPA|nr:hypothetical protein A9Z42_0078050 [Trichoderma parareesei]